MTYEVSLSKFWNLKERPCFHQYNRYQESQEKGEKTATMFDNSQKLMPQHNHSKKKKTKQKECNDIFNPNDFFLSG